MGDVLEKKAGGCLLPKLTPLPVAEAHLALSVTKATVL